MTSLAGNPTSNPAVRDSGGQSLGRIVLTTLPAILLILVCYVWLTSIGTWTTWPARSSYYDMLASAFRHGQLFLELKPDPVLLSLPNVYDPAQRQDLPYLPDASLYQGRYYLYFGPVPALILVVAGAIVPGVISDEVLVFAFTCGILLVLCLLMIKIWGRFFPRVPPWMVGCSILLVGLISPSGWMLGNRAAVHDTAIAGGQVFFLAGLCAALEAFAGESVRRSRAIAAGVFWAASLGCRITQIVPIAFMLVLIVVTILRKQGQAARFSKSLDPMLPFLLPVALGLAGLAWYNWARFGSVFETGIRYQLALLYIQGHWQELFSIRYAPQNLYNYILNPPKLRYNFPYVWPQQGFLRPITSAFALPGLYYAEEMTGLVYTAPFLAFTLVALIRPGRSEATGSFKLSQPDLLTWLKVALAGSFVCGFAFTLLFFWASERYLFDFIPSALLLGVIGLWQSSETLSSRPRGHTALILLALGLILASIGISSLLAVALNSDGFRQLDPLLWRQLNNLFRP
jgi:hypothetical protein